MCGVCGCGGEDGKAILTMPNNKAQQAILNAHNLEYHHGDEHQPDHHHHSHEHGHHHHHHHSGDGSKTVIELERDILNQNQLGAEKNRGYFDAKNMIVLNLVSSPGSGKTSLLEKTLADLRDKYNFYVIEGDQQTLNDANLTR
ncbi:MAG: GTP-binding protein [Saprospiraceae bacterium]